MKDLANHEDMAFAKPFASVELDSTTGRVSGYDLAGAKSGPTILVAGTSQLIHSVYERLKALPTLPWMRGRIMLHILSQNGCDANMPTEPVDEVLYLPGLVVPNLSEDAIKDSYMSILRLATRVGMIEGRGVALA